MIINLKYEKAIQKISNEPNRKPKKKKKIRMDTESEFYNRSVKSWFQDNDVEMYWAHTEGKSVVAERFIRAIKNKIDKHMTSVSKNV